jgi:hypothetical protein
MGQYIPSNLETEISLDELLKKYSEGIRYGQFSIISFKKPEKTKATIHFENIACLSGGVTELEYLVNEDNSVKYEKPTFVMMS